jgi:hypothetical protein
VTTAAIAATDLAEPGHALVRSHFDQDHFTAKQ